MTITPNLNLKKPGSSDPIDISVLNENADTLDAFAGETNTALSGKQDSIADLSEIRSGAAAGATAVQQTAFETDQARQDALDAEMAEEIKTNKNNISSLQDMQTNYMKLVYRHYFGQSSGTASYRMAVTDFTSVDNAQLCGMYLITIINWSTTPNASIYIAYYSGGTPTYNALTKIGGADAQINIDENRNINYTGKGKIQIYALQ